MKVNPDLVRQWANCLAILGAFITNILANIAPINGLTIGEISQTFFKEVLIIPASYAFAIWGLIYLGLISLGIYQVLPYNREHPRLRKMGYWLTLSSLAQIIWVYVFLYRWFLLSVLAMVAILIPLIVLYLRLEIALEPLTFKQRWLVNFPISLYLGWISVATIVNIASALDFAGWGQWGITDINWTIMMILIGGIIAIWVRLQRYDQVYCGVFVWAFVAISLRHLETISIAATAGSLGILLILLMLIPQHNEC